MQKEYVLSLNDFREPKVLEGKAAIATILVRLILLNPGTMPDRPLMGVGLVEKYRYSFPEDVNELKKEIKRQIQLYLPRYQGAEVDVLLNKDNTLTIGVKIDEVLYQLETSELMDNQIEMSSLTE